jgi:hypothetical protein
MQAVTTPLAPVLLALLLVAAGGLATPLRALPAERRVVARAIAGLLLLHVVLLAWQLAGVRWSAVTVSAPLVVAAALGAWRARQRGTARRALRPFDWGDAVALLALLVFAAMAWSGWIVMPDFVYHWGLKAHRFALAGGIDYAFLARPENWLVHPDYPNLWPETLAATALLAGHWHEPSLLAGTTALLLLLLLAARGALRDATLPVVRRAAVLAALALACAGFGIGYSLAGAADWLLALALVAALPALREPAAARGTSGALEIGLAAALAAASKIEGMPLAAAIVSVQLVRLLRAHRLRPQAADLRAAAALVLPSVIVVAPWAWSVRTHHLFMAMNATRPSLARLGAAAPALLSTLQLPEWHGMTLALLLLPLLFLAPALRAFAVVASLQLAFDLWAYAATPVDPVALALTSFPRLVLQLLPAIVVAAAVAWLDEPPQDATAIDAPAEPAATFAAPAVQRAE